MEDFYSTNDLSNHQRLGNLMGRMPGGFLKWGIIVVFSFITCALVLSWFIKYPDTLSAEFVLSTQVAPNAVLTKMAGRINFFVEDGESVIENQVLGYIESTSSIKDVTSLYEALNVSDESQISNLEYLKTFDGKYSLGSLEPMYSTFLYSVNDYLFFKEFSFYAERRENILTRIEERKSLITQAQVILQISQNEYSLVKKKFLINEKLFQEKVISELDFDIVKQELYNKEYSIETSKSNIANHRISISNLKSELLNLKSDNLNGSKNLFNKLKADYKNLLSQLEEWKFNYLLMAPIPGKVSFPMLWKEKHYIQKDIEIMTIVPELSEYSGQLNMPVSRSGKVEQGSLVLIEFHSFPKKEYGLVQGKIDKIALIPRNDYYSVQLSLPNGLSTTYSKTLEYKPNMKGTARIIVDDTSLLERIFFEVRRLLD